MAKIFDTDKGFKKLIKEVERIGRMEAKAGWVENSSKDTRREAGITNAEVALSVINGNLRTGQPPRDFLKNVENDKGAGYIRLLGEQVKTQVRNYTPKNRKAFVQDYRKVLTKVAIQATSDIKLELKDNTGRYRENANSTIKTWQSKRRSNRNASKKLFVDTSQLINSITSVVK